MAKGLSRGERYWLGLSPVTRDEMNRAFRYLRNHGRPQDPLLARRRVARLRKRAELNRYLKGKEEAATDPSNPWQVIFGTVQTGGTVTCIHVSGPAEQPNLYQHLIITLAAHEIAYLRKVFFDGYEVQWDTDLLTRPTGVVQAQGVFAGLVKMQINYGTESQAALSEFVAECSTIWTSDHRQLGQAHVYLRLKANENVFKGGTPDITFRLTGKSNVYNPASGVEEISGNAAMVLLDYMTNARWGLGIPYDSDNFNTARWRDAATTCGDSIGLAAGGAEPRYWLDFQAGMDEAPGALVDEMLASMAGRLVYSEGRYSLHAGGVRDPVLSISEDMILSEVRVATKAPRADSFNAVRGTFVSEANDFEESDFPPVVNSAYVAQDSGQTIYEDLTFNMVTSAPRCQRLAKIELATSRQGLVAEFDARLDAYKAEPAEWVNVTFPELGWSEKLFEVLRSALRIDDGPDGAPRFSVHLVLQEIAAECFYWHLEDSPFDPNPNTNLPDPFSVADPTGLAVASGTEHLYVRGDGTVASRMFVTWTAAADAFVQNGGHYELQLNFAGTSNWQDVGIVPGGSTSYYIVDAQDGQAYDVRIRSVNGMGARGNWVYAWHHVVVGKTRPPSDVPWIGVAFEGMGIRVTWAKVPDADLLEYELRIGNQFNGWDDPPATIGRFRSTTYLHRSLPAGTVRFLVKAIDTSGNESAREAAADISIPPPGAPRNLTVGQIDGNVLLRWDPPEAPRFPVDYYRVFRRDGDDFREIGRGAGTFATYLEALPGVYTYSVSAVDAAGNEGLAASFAASISISPDYVLRPTTPLDLSTAHAEFGLYLPDPFSIEGVVDVTATWQEHFEANGVETFQDFIDDGYSYFLEPIVGDTGLAIFTTSGPSMLLGTDDAAATWEGHFLHATSSPVSDLQGFIDRGFKYFFEPSGYDSAMVVEADLGLVLPQAIVNFDYVYFGSGIKPRPRIDWRAGPGDPWTYGEENSKKAAMTNVRYLRFRLDAPGNWCVVTDPSLTVHVREITDSGSASVDSGDPGGTVVGFNRDFLDVSAIVVTPQGTTELKPVVDFDDSPFPSSFKVFLFDSAGSRASGVVRWNARGVQAAS